MRYTNELERLSPIIFVFVFHICIDLNDQLLGSPLMAPQAMSRRTCNVAPSKFSMRYAAEFA